jgi:hypothetical protein
VTEAEKRLLDCFRRCDESARRDLLLRAQTLAGGHAGKALSPAAAPVKSTGAESVIMAIRRLRQTYPSADRRKLFGVTSTLLSAHVIEGRAAEDVITELEQAFVRLSAAADGKAGGPHA